MNAPMNMDHQNTSADEPIFDPFPEPSGYPSGWDLSSLNTANPSSPAQAWDETGK